VIPAILKLEHVDETKEILMRILLARIIHIVVTPLRFEESIRFWMVIHGGVEVVKSSVPTRRLLASFKSGLLAFVFSVRPVLSGQVSHGAENAVVSRSGASIVAADWIVEIAVEFWRVQQALQYSVAVAQKSRISQSFGLVYTVGPSHKRPAFADATVDDTSKVSSFAHYRPGVLGLGIGHGCIGHGLLVGWGARGYSSKDQLRRIALIWGCIDGCVDVCESRTCGQQSMLSVQEEKISASKKKRRLKEEMRKRKSRRQDLWRR
jgi:hypothetical protein